MGVAAITTHLGHFETYVCIGLEVLKVCENTLLELFHVACGTAEGIEAKSEGAHDVGAGDVVAAVPKNARDKLAQGKEKTMEKGVGYGGCARRI